METAMRCANWRIRFTAIVFAGLLLPATAEAWTKEDVAECGDRAAAAAEKAAAAVKASGGDDHTALMRGADALAEILERCMPSPGEPEHRRL
jgi:hypothetical protein